MTFLAGVYSGLKFPIRGNKWVSATFQVVIHCLSQGFFFFRWNLGYPPFSGPLSPLVALNHESEQVKFGWNWWKFNKCQTEFPSSRKCLGARLRPFGVYLYLQKKKFGMFGWNLPKCETFGFRYAPRESLGSVVCQGSLQSYSNPIL